MRPARNGAVRRVGVSLGLLLFVALAEAQAPAPTLSEANRLKLQNVALRIQVAQLQAQAAQRAFEEAREELTALVGTLKVEGYTLDLQTMGYVKEGPKEKPSGPPK